MSNLLMRIAAGAALLVGAAARLPAQTHLVIVSGLGGDAKHSATFNSISSSIANAAATRFALPDSDIIWLGEDTTATRPHYRGLSTKINVEQTLERLAARAGPNDQIVIVLIGHGSGEGADTKISIPGPDLTAHDFAELLARFPTQRVAFINLTSASGDMLPLLSAPNRVVITATKSAFERNDSRFAQYFADALSKDVADTDKDGRVSLLEAFRYAVTETKRFYDTDTRLQTEHAQLEDMGAKTGAPDPDGRTGEGLLARRFFFDAVAVPKSVGNDAQLATLYKDRFTLEDQIDQLRTKKTTMSADAYDDALEGLLVQLARKAKTIREIEGRK